MAEDLIPRKMASSSWALSRISNLQKHLNPTSKGERIVKISPEVSEALSLGKPLVAFESTIISHGMPYPQNLETAKEVEAIVRKNGAIPATIAILDGVPCIGLSLEELERLAILGKKAQKTARRDIAHVVATGGHGATTVSATMFLASMVGIPIFVTGGIGGVHRHGESTLDISSDLTELGRTPVTVISAGVKSILDISRTLEYLETQGVCVAAYQTSEFPAFFTERSGYKAPCRVESPEDCARLIDTSINLKLETGILVAVPIPSEHSVSGNIIESAIQKALIEAWYYVSDHLFRVAFGLMDFKWKDLNCVNSTPSQIGVNFLRSSQIFHDSKPTKTTTNGLSTMEFESIFISLNPNATSIFIVYYLPITLTNWSCTGGVTQGAEY